jgi:hypothetical protein
LAFSALGAAEEAKPTEVKRCTAAEWCFEDDLPKAKCVNCDKKVILQLKKDKDYCSEHKDAESLCVQCDPKVQATIDAMRPDQKEWPKDWKPKSAAK